VVEPVDPFQRGELDSFERPPWSSPVDDFGLVKAIDRLGQSVVIAVANTPDRGFDPGFGEALAVFYGYVLGGFNWSSQRIKNWRRAMDNKKRRSDRCARSWYGLSG